MSTTEVARDSSLDTSPTCRPLDDGGTTPDIPCCPKRGHENVYDLTTGVVLPKPCQMVSCPHCGPLQVLRRKNAVTYSRPEANFTLTFPGGIKRGFDSIRRGVNRFTEFLRRRGHKAQIAWVVEDDPGDDGQHVHGVLHSAPTLTEPTVQEIAQSAGFGPQATVRQFRTGAHAAEEASIASGYLFKTVTGHPLRSQAAADGLQAFLSLNGGHAGHSTRAFFRTPDGATVTATTATIAAQRGYRLGKMRTTTTTIAA